MEQKKIAGAVVLYNPLSDVFENIKSYMGDVDKLFVIDNSEIPNKELLLKLRAIDKILCIPQSENKGIAYALNLAAKLALEENFSYLLTMDQDSKANPGMVLSLLNCFSLEKKIAIVSALHYLLIGEKITKEIYNCSQVLTVMTSGNLVRLSILKEIGGYNEDLFIDYVDHDLCFRLNRLGYKVFICNKAILDHRLGEIEQKKFFLRSVYPTNHQPLRYYYQTRNRFFIYKHYKKYYPDFIREDKKNSRRNFLKMILFENHKIKKIRYSIRGYLDYKRSKFGKFNYV